MVPLLLLFSVSGMAHFVPVKVRPWTLVAKCSEAQVESCENC